MATNQQDWTALAERSEPSDGEGGNRSAFTPEEWERLRRLRRQVLTGARSDAYPVDKRQDFVRWLVAQGKLSDN
jgi:hypothetical protein